MCVRLDVRVRARLVPTILKVDTPVPLKRRRLRINVTI